LDCPAGINTFAYAEGYPTSAVDPTGQFINVPGIIIGAGIEIAIQAYGNYKDGCDALDWKNYDLWNIGVAAAVGAFAPGALNGLKGLYPKWVPFVGSSRGSGGALRNLSEQLGRAQTPNRASKVAERMAAHEDRIVDNAVYQGAYQGAKKLVSDVPDPNRCTCRK
jgi:hypothetical protein